MGDFEYIADTRLDDMQNGISLFVFRENINDMNGISGLAHFDIAQIGDFDDALIGNPALQAVLRGGSQNGLYETTIISGLQSITRLNDTSDFLGFQADPDYTISGGSGAPLFVNGFVVGVNNQGNGQYGAITNHRLLEDLILDATMRFHGFGGLVR